MSLHQAPSLLFFVFFFNQGRRPGCLGFVTMRQAGGKKERTNPRGLLYGVLVAVWRQEYGRSGGLNGRPGNIGKNKQTQDISLII
ncbi:hypothetical protein QBC36DRAFT_318975, partial [Triangularia setosa]